MTPLLLRSLRSRCLLIAPPSRPLAWSILAYAPSSDHSPPPTPGSAIVLHVLLYTILLGAELRLPDLLDKLGEADVVGVELVDAVRGANRAEAEKPAAECAEGAKLALVDVVVNARHEADVRVTEESEAEDAVDDGLGLASPRANE